MRLTPIEGLRGFLALWVLLGHTLQTVGTAGYWGSVVHWIPDSQLAVKCFMVISGFVIFLLLDTKREPYKVFITRRFFRIYPVYILLFALAIPCSLLWQAEVLHARDLGWLSPRWVDIYTTSIGHYWSGIWYHVPLHLLLLQGLIPEDVLPGSALAFLEPAWSLSLEWQFYLVAPLFFYLFTTKANWKRISAFGACLLMVIFSRRYIPSIGMNAALPSQIEYFFLGWFSYFLYSSLAHLNLKGDRVFPAALIISVAVYKTSGKDEALLGFLIWGVFFSLLLEPVGSISTRFITSLFSNKVSMWLGKISYSIYLSHVLVIVVLKWCLFKIFPTATPAEHYLMLTPLVLAMTVLISSGLYLAVEAPFIRLGAKLTGGKPRPLAVVGRQN